MDALLRADVILLSGLSYFFPAAAEAMADSLTMADAAETIPAAGLSSFCYCVETAVADAAVSANHFSVKRGAGQPGSPFLCHVQ